MATETTGPVLQPQARLVRLNDLIGELYALYRGIPGSPGLDVEVNEALTNVRRTMAHAIALGLAEAKQRPEHFG